MATVLFLVILGGVVAALGVAAWPRHARPVADRTLRGDLMTGAAMLRGLGEQRWRTLERYIDEMRGVGGHPKIGC